MLAKDLRISEDELISRLETTRGFLFNDRSKRIHPNRDDGVCLVLVRNPGTLSDRFPHGTQSPFRQGIPKQKPATE